MKIIADQNRTTTEVFYCVCPFIVISLSRLLSLKQGSVRVAERLALPTLDHGVVGSNPAGGEILPEPKRRFIAQSLSCSPFHRLEMTEILLKGRKTLTHPSIIETGTGTHNDNDMSSRLSFCLPCARINPYFA